MLCIRFTSIILLGLLFAHQALAVSGKDVASKQKEIGDEVTSSLSKKIEGVGGRKMMMRNQEYYLRKEYFTAGGTTSTKNISGKDHSKASTKSLGRSQEMLNTDQDITTMLEPIQTLKSASFGIPRNNKAVSGVSLESSTTYRVDEEISHEKDETRSLLEAAKEMVNLMHKDYRGMGRRNPPINNHEPKH